MRPAPAPTRTVTPLGWADDVVADGGGQFAGPQPGPDAKGQQGQGPSARRHAWRWKRRPGPKLCSFLGAVGRLGRQSRENGVASAGLPEPPSERSTER